MAFPRRQRAACVHEQKKSGPGKSSCQGGRPVNPGKPSCGVQTKLRPPWSGGLHGALSLESTTSCLGQNVRFSHALATKKFRACAKTHVFPKGDVSVTPVSGMILSHCDIRTIHAPAILLTPMTAGMMALPPRANSSPSFTDQLQPGKHQQDTDRADQPRNQEIPSLQSPGRVGDRVGWC